MDIQKLLQRSYVRIKFVSEGKFIHTELNTNMSNIIKKYNKLISHWIFGHTHDTFELIKDYIHYVCNPRGRPSLNRIKYNLTNLIYKLYNI